MNCKNCNCQSPNDAKFCNSCGKPMESEPSDINFEEMSKHLEFLGYKVELIKAAKEGEKDRMVAVHSKRSNIIVLTLLPGLILYAINLTTKKKFNEEMSAFLNNANKILISTKVYYEIEDEIVVLRFESIYTGNYNKEVFSQFIESLNNDVDNLFRQGKDFDKIFIS